MSAVLHLQPPTQIEDPALKKMMDTSPKIRACNKLKRLSVVQSDYAAESRESAEHEKGKLDRLDFFEKYLYRNIWELAEKLGRKVWSPIRRQEMRAEFNKYIYLLCRHLDYRKAEDDKVNKLFHETRKLELKAVFTLARTVCQEGDEVIELANKYEVSEADTVTCEDPNMADVEESKNDDVDELNMSMMEEEADQVHCQKYKLQTTEPKTETKN